MAASSLGEIATRKRKEKGFTQEELALRSGVDTRTVQRIEKSEVKPHFPTLKNLSGALECDLISELNSKPWDFSEDEVKSYRETFNRRRTVRLTLMITALAAMLVVASTFPAFRLFGLPKTVWAPFFYLFMFGYILFVGLVWRCPACKASLGSPFNTRLCPRCGSSFSLSERRPKKSRTNLSYL